MDSAHQSSSSGTSLPLSKCGCAWKVVVRNSPRCESPAASIARESFTETAWRPLISWRSPSLFVKTNG